MKIEPYTNNNKTIWIKVYDFGPKEDPMLLATDIQVNYKTTVFTNINLKFGTITGILMQGYNIDIGGLEKFIQNRFL